MIQVGGYHDYIEGVQYIGEKNEFMTEFNECFGIKILCFVSH